MYIIVPPQENLLVRLLMKSYTLVKVKGYFVATLISLFSTLIVSNFEGYN